MKIRPVSASYGDRDDDRDDYDDDDDVDDDDVTLSSNDRGQHAAPDLRRTPVSSVPVDNIRIPRCHSMSHSAPDPLASTTVRQTSDVPHTSTLAETTADIEARMSARLDQRIASLEADYKCAIASFASASDSGANSPPTILRTNRPVT
jgi:hypothetical protein